MSDKISQRELRVLDIIGDFRKATKDDFNDQYTDPAEEMDDAVTKIIEKIESGISLKKALKPYIFYVDEKNKHIDGFTLGVINRLGGRGYNFDIHDL